MSEVERRAVYVGTPAALQAMRDGTREVVVAQIRLPDGSTALQVRLLSEVIAAIPRTAPARVLPEQRVPYRRPAWSLKRRAAVAGSIAVGLVAIVGAGIWLLSLLVSAVASRGGAAFGVALVVVAVVLLLKGGGGGGGKTFSGTFHGTLR